MAPPKTSSPGSEALFAYGTLIFEEVMEAVAGPVGDWIDAELVDFERRRLRGVVYPGIAPRPGARVAGRLWTGLGPSSLERLDRFEGPMYRRERVSVCAQGRERVALAYVVAPGFRWMMTGREWCPEAFRACSLDRYRVRVQRG